MTIEYTRRVNAKTLAAEAGSDSRFAQRLGVIRQRVSIIIGKNPTRKIGDAAARQMEREFGRPVGWMDQDHSEPGKPMDGLGSVVVGAFDMGAALGVSRFPMLREAAVRQLSISREFVRRYLQGSAAEHLAIVTLSGSAMDAPLGDGSVALVDRAASAVKQEGVYLLARKDGGEADVWCRRVHRSPDGSWRVVADNKGYPETQGKTWKDTGLIVLGRVVASLEIKPLV